MAKYTKEEKQKAIDLYIRYCKKGQKAAVAVANKILNIGYALCKSRSTYSYEGCETELRRKLKSYGLEAIAGTNANSAAEVTRPAN